MIKLPLANKELAFKVILLLITMFIMVWRIPDIVTTPRFWAEEGNYYFAHAYKNGVIAGLIQHNGYYAIVLNIAVTIATFVRLEYAPFVTTIISFIVQMIVCSIVIFGNAPYWETNSRKFIICSGITLLAPPEVWLNTICLQFWFCLSSFLILFEDTDRASRLKKMWYRFLLVIGGMNGVLSSFLLPAYLIRLLHKKNRENFVQASILTFTSLLQASLFLSTMILNSNSIAKSHVLDRLSTEAVSFRKIVFVQFIWPFIGYTSPELLINKIRNFSNAIGVSISLPIIIIVIAIILMYISLFLMFFKTYNYKLNVYLFTCFIIVLIMSNLFSFKHIFSQRYAFTPSIMLFIFMTHQMFSFPKTIFRVFAGVAVSVALLFSLKQLNKNDFMETTGPIWKDEISAWRLDCSYKPKIWPHRADWPWEIELPCKKEN